MGINTKTILIVIGACLFFGVLAVTTTVEMWDQRTRRRNAEAEIKAIKATENVALKTCERNADEAAKTAKKREEDDAKTIKDLTQERDRLARKIRMGKNSTLNITVAP